MKNHVCIFICLTMLLMSVCAMADQLSLSDFTMEEVADALFDTYSLDELLEVKSLLDNEIAARQRQWALEHANRQVSFEQDNIILFKGKTMKVSPIVTRMTEDAPEKTTFVWSTDNPEVAKYNNDTGITAVGKGTATLTCVAKDDEAVIGSIVVTVVLPVNEVKISGSTDKLLLGASPEQACVDLHVAIAPEEAHIKDVAWTSSDISIATVDDNGHVQAVKAGTVTITATSLDDSSASAKKATYRITVTQAVTEINLSENTVTIGSGKSLSLKTTVMPDTATNKRLSWTTSDKDVASYSEGRIVAKNPGTCVITATADDGSGTIATCNVQVIRLITGVSFAEKAITMTAGEKSELQAVVQPTDATNKRMTWESTDNSIASVSSSGVITAKKAGNCTISVTTTDGTDKKATIKLTVYPSVQELLSKDTWYYNGGSNTTLNRISFSGSTATVEQVAFDGNGKHSGGKASGKYSVDNNVISVALDGGKKLSITYSVKEGSLSLENGKYFTLAEVEQGLQGYWKVRTTGNVVWSNAWSENNIYINKGKLKHENASKDMTGRYAYWYYGPYSGSYSLTFGGFDTNAEQAQWWFWNIINGKPTILYYDHVASPSTKLPGQNGY